MKKTNMYKNMKSNMGNLNPAQVQFRINHFLNNTLSPKLDEIGLFDYVNDEMEQDYNKIEKYAKNYIKCIKVNKTHELFDLIDTIDLSGNSKDDLVMDAFFSKSLDTLISYFQKTKAFNQKCEEYIDNYIIPILSNEEKIIFDINSTDEEIKKKTDDTLTMLSKLVGEKGSLGAYMKFGCIEFDEETYNIINFLYIDNDKIKKEIATSLCNDFITRYDKIDFNNIKDFNTKIFYSL